MAVSEPVARDYQRRMEDLRTFALNRGKKLQKKNLDETCCLYVNNIFDLGYDLHDATKTLAAVIDCHPDFGPKEKLPQTRRALQGWQKIISSHK